MPGNVADAIEVCLNMGLAREFGAFVRKQIASSVFALCIFALLATAYVAPFPRYDVLFVGCLAVQVWMIRSGLESRNELIFICLFHAVGLGLEAYKVSKGSWAYPEPALAKFMGVPLYSGFMYSAIASYILQAWKNFDLEFFGLPKPWVAWAGCVAIYGNFIVSHFWLDVRYAIIALLLSAFGGSRVEFTAEQRRFRMPLPVAFTLIGFFVWVAENLCTYLRAWEYPHQASGWAMVHTSKIVSWSMMVVISFVIVWRWQVRAEQRRLTETPSNATKSPPLPYAEGGLGSDR